MKKLNLKKKTTTEKKAKTRTRLMSIGFGATDSLIKKIDVVAKKKNMTRAKFMKTCVEAKI